MKEVRRVSLSLLCVSFLFVSSAVRAAEYIGPDACKVCHSAIYDDYSKSGHPYKLNKVEGGKAPVYPFSEVPKTPDGYTWDDVTYVIGGYGWKARFIDKKGYIVTGDKVQYNLATKGWSAYDASVPNGTKPYNCGACHTTGWQTTEENGGKKQDNLEGMAGTFAFPGITCEACHGPGSAHKSSMKKVDITKDTSKEMCGTCHYRDSGHKIAASGGFIRHHEQYDELINSPHRFMECITCHDPHKSTKYVMGGVKKDPACISCHSTMSVKVSSMAKFTCETCHMPLAAKSAVTTGVDGKLGDIHAHTYRLNTNPDSKMYSDDGKFVELDSDGNAIVKVEYACANCHNGQVAQAETVDWMYANAIVVHTGGPTVVADISDIPESFTLHQNFPNPFNPVTNIRFDLEKPGHVRVDVYDIRGALVTTLIDQFKSAGRHLATWNGMADNGQTVSSGIYIYRITVGKHVASRQMTLVR